MKKLLTLAAVFSLLCGSLVFTPVATEAASWNPFSAACSNTSDSTGQGSSDICKDGSKSSNPVSGSNGLLVKITDLVAFIAGAVAVIMLVVSGLKFTLSGGSSEEIASARRTIIYTLVGIVIIVMGRTLIVYVISKVK